MLFHVFDRAEGRPENGKMPNPTTYGSFNDEGVPFWKEAFWKPESVMFPKADADCEDVFAGKMPLAELTAQATMQEWQSALQEVARGRTIAITRGDETIARIVPCRRRTSRMECQQSDVQRVGVHNWSHTPPFRAACVGLAVAAITRSWKLCARLSSGLS